MTIVHEYSTLGKRIIEDYVNAFLEDVKKLSPEGIDYLRHKECLGNFNSHYAKRKNFNMAKIIQGVNEIDLAVMMYNLTETNGSWN